MSPPSIFSEERERKESCPCEGSDRSGMAGNATSIVTVVARASFICSGRRWWATAWADDKLEHGRKTSRVSRA